MFNEARFLQNSFSVTFSRVSTIRRMANAFEDALTAVAPGHYTQPHVIPVPDDFEPELPRLIFGSKHGFSQIIVSQVSLVLNVSYTPDWQLDIAKGENYLGERVKVLFSLLDTLDDVQPSFSGLVTHARLAADALPGEQAILRHLAERYTPDIGGENVHDLQVKITRVQEDRFFDNLTIKNVRVWKIDAPTGDVVRLPAGKAIAHAIDVVGDYNDRYSFNERTGYFTSAAVAHEIIVNGIAAVNEEAKRMRGDVS